jgi:hypothetical protein
VVRSASVIAKEQCCESRRQDSALDLHLGSSVSQRSLHDGWEQQCAKTHAIGIEDSYRLQTSRTAGVLETLNVMVRETKTAVVGTEACRCPV